MKHTFVAADGKNKTVNIPDEVLQQGKRERLTVKETIERYLSDEGYIVDPTVAELTNKAKINKVNGAGRQQGEKKKRKPPTRKPDQVKRDLIQSLFGHIDNYGGVYDCEVTNIERIIAFSIVTDKYEITLSKKRKPKTDA
jgi:hypothetical protein